MEEQKLKAFIVEEKPTFSRGDIQEEKIIGNIYSRRLEDLTFNDLNMMGYTNPNIFVREWIENKGLFDNDKIIWVVVYLEENK